MLDCFAMSRRDQRREQQTKETKKPIETWAYRYNWRRESPPTACSLPFARLRRSRQEHLKHRLESPPSIVIAR